MADFIISYRLTSLNEGGYANNPADRGGETFKGLSRKFWPSWSGWKNIDAIKARVGKGAAAIDKAAAQDQYLLLQVQSFYIAQFWKPLNLTSISSQRVADKVYDIAVNMGVSVAGEFMQRAVNLFRAPGSKIAVDGEPGAQTTAAVNLLSSKDTDLLIKYISSLQGAKYAAIIEANPSQYVFTRSWGARL